MERNVMLPLGVIGLPRDGRLRRATRVLDLVGLAEFRKRFLATVGGMQQRASIARALSFEPDPLFLAHGTKSPVTD